MTLRFTPASRDDWRLLLTLARCVRLTAKEDAARVLQRWEAEQQTPSATVRVPWVEEERTTSPWSPELARQIAETKAHGQEL